MGDKEEQRLLRTLQRGGAKPQPTAFKPPPGPFGGPSKEDNKCAICNKSVYVNEKVTGLAASIHTKCFKCTVCSRSLSTGNNVLWEGKYYCQADGKKMALHFNSRSSSGEIEVVKSSIPHIEDPETEIKKLRSASVDIGEFHSYNNSNHSSTHTSGTSTPVGNITPPESPVIDSRSIMGTFGAPSPIDIPSDISGDRETVDALLRASYGRNTTVMVKLKSDPVKEKSEEEVVLPPQVLAAVGNSGTGSARAKRLSIKTDKCVSCGKSVYQLERMQADNGKVYHKGCFKCSICQQTLDLTNFATHEDKLYCENHFKNLRNLKSAALLEKERSSEEGQYSLRREQEEKEREREIEREKEREKEKEKAIRTREEIIKNGQITTATVAVSLDDKAAAEREERMWAQREHRLQRAALEKQMNDPAEFERYREEEKKRVLALRSSGSGADREKREEERKAKEEHERKEREEKEKKEREEKERKEKEEKERREKEEREEKEEKERKEKEEKEKKAKEEEERLKKEKEEQERLERERALQEKEKAEREAEEWEKMQQELRKKATEAAERFLREPEPVSVTPESVPTQAPPEDETESEEESSDTVSPTITPSHSSNQLLWVPLTPGLTPAPPAEPTSEKTKEERKLEREQKRKEKEERRIRREERRARRAAREERRKKREEAAQKKATEQQPQAPVELTAQ